MRVCDVCNCELDNSSWTIAVDDYEDLCDDCWEYENAGICKHCRIPSEMHDECSLCEDGFVCEKDPGCLNETTCGECQTQINPKACDQCGTPVHHKYLYCLNCGSGELRYTSEYHVPPLPFYLRGVE